MDYSARRNVMAVTGGNDPEVIQSLWKKRKSMFEYLATAAALQNLLSMKEQFYGESGFYNALYQSDLQLQSVTIDQGTAIIHLMGTLMLGGVCDNPRMEAQIEQTALQFSTVSDVPVFVNDTPLEEVLSQK